MKIGRITNMYERRAMCQIFIHFAQYFKFITGWGGGKICSIGYSFRTEFEIVKFYLDGNYSKKNRSEIFIMNNHDNVGEMFLKIMWKLC